MGRGHVTPTHARFKKNQIVFNWENKAEQNETKLEEFKQAVDVSETNNTK